MEATGDAAFERGEATSFTAQPRNAGFTGFYGRDLGSSAPTMGRVPSFYYLAKNTGGVYLEDNTGSLSVGEAIRRVGLDVTVRHNKIKVVETEFVLAVNGAGEPEMVEQETGRLLDMPAWRATVGYPHDGG